MNYTLITDNLIVGSQPQKPEDIDHLKKEEGQDKDVENWGIDVKSITRCHELDVRHMRRLAIEFDPNSLRKKKPTCVIIVTQKGKIKQ
ncbi:hypothetical protein S245_003972, partial [Arachis hypogaea]